MRRRERNWRGPGDLAKGTVRCLCLKGNRTMTIREPGMHVLFNSITPLSEFIMLTNGRIKIVR